MAFDIAGMGGVAEGMQQGNSARNQIRMQDENIRRMNQEAESRASAVRQQQEQEAFGRLQRANAERAGGAMQFNPGTLPQGEVRGQVSGGAAQQQKPATSGETDYSAWGSVPAGTTPTTPPSSTFQTGNLGRNAPKPQGTKDWVEGNPMGNPIASPGLPAAAGRTTDWAEGYPMGNQITPPPTPTPGGQQTPWSQKSQQERFDALKGANVTGAPATAAAPGKKGQQPTPPDFPTQGSNIASRMRLLQEELKQNPTDAALLKEIAFLEKQGAGYSVPSTGPTTAAGVRSGTPALQQTAQAQAPTAAPAQAPVVGQQASVMGGPDVDNQLSMAKQQFDFLKFKLANTFDGAAKMEIMGQMNQLNGMAQALNLDKLGRAAAVNPQHLNQLTAIFAGTNGMELAAQPVGNGNFRLVTKDGQPLGGSWGQPMPLASLASAMSGSLSASIRAQNAEIANTYSQAKAKAGGEAAAKAPYEQQLQITKNQGMAEVSELNNNAAMIQQALKHQMEMGNLGQPVPLPDGSVIQANKQGGAILHRPDVTTNGVVSRPPPEVISAPQLANYGIHLPVQGNANVGGRG